MPEFDPDVDYYEILQVHSRAHQEVIKRAYHTIMATLQGHPDLGGSHEAAIRVNQAYAVLSDVESRKAYDAARRYRKTAGLAPNPSPQDVSAPRVHPLPAGNRQAVYCPHCGARNRLRAGTDIRQAVCGKCRTPLLRAASSGLNGDHAREIRLQRRMDRELERHSELHLHSVHVPRGKPLHCLRCQYEWPAPSGNGLPEHCPRCGSRRWSDFRIFLCRFCRERFSSNVMIVVPYLSLSFWPWPYWLFPACPSCGKAHWHNDCERHPLRGLLNLVNRTGKVFR